MIEMKVKGIALDTNNLATVVVLKDSEERKYLPIWVGYNEATAIALALEGMKPPRPLTHDLMKSIVEQCNLKIDKIFISELKDGTYYAQMNVEAGGNVLNIDSRPSDAIALALRLKIPIYVSEMVVMEASVDADPEKEREESKKLEKFIEDIKPEDFLKM
jgi:bifunctional DNase/RNase